MRSLAFAALFVPGLALAEEPAASTDTTAATTTDAPATTEAPPAAPPTAPTAEECKLKPDDEMCKKMAADAATAPTETAGKKKKKLEKSDSGRMEAEETRE